MVQHVKVCYVYLLEELGFNEHRQKRENKLVFVLSEAVVCLKIKDGGQGSGKLEE
jgi:hypothetical protein